MKTVILFVTMLLAIDLFALTTDEIKKELSAYPPPSGIEKFSVLETTTSFEINGEATSFETILQFMKNLNSSPRIKVNFVLDNARVITVNDPQSKKIIEKFVIVTKK